MLPKVIISTSGEVVYPQTTLTDNRGKPMDLLEDRFFNPEKLRAQETYNYRMEGKEEGRDERTAEIAVKMIKCDMSIETISELTDLSKEEILRLKEELS